MAMNGNKSVAEQFCNEPSVSVCKQAGSNLQQQYPRQHRYKVKRQWFGAGSTTFINSVQAKQQASRRESIVSKQSRIIHEKGKPKRRMLRIVSKGKNKTSQRTS